MDSVDYDALGTRVAKSLNEDFLNGQLGRYFRAKALAWMTSDPTARDESDDMVWPDTKRAAEVRERLGDSYAPGRAEDPSAVRIIDEFMLAQHAGECLLRHFFAVDDAHRHNSAAWLEMARLQGSAKFRARVQEVCAATDESLTEMVSNVWLPSDIFKNPKQPTPGPEVLDAAVRFCRSWIGHFAQLFLESGPGYNAAKHGLAVVPGFSRLSVAFPDDEDAVEARTVLEGAEVRTLEYDWTSDGQRRWRRMTRYVDPPGLIAWTLIAAELLDWLWSIERTRHFGPPGDVHIYWAPLPSDTVSGRGMSWGGVRMDIGLLPTLAPPERDGGARPGEE